MTNHELARAAAESIYDHDGTRVCPDIIADAYAPAMADLERLRRQVEFVKRESLLAIPSPYGSPSEIRCLLCKNTWWHECPPNHAPNCPHAKEAT
jgi:hypothetical protein